MDRDLLNPGNSAICVEGVVIEAKTVSDDLSTDFGNDQICCLGRNDVRQCGLKRCPFRGKRRSEVFGEIEQCVCIFLCRFPDRYSQFSPSDLDTPYILRWHLPHTTLEDLSTKLLVLIS